MRKPHIPPLREIDWKHLIRRLIASIGDGWYFHGDPMSQDRRRLVLCNYTSNVIANLVGGSLCDALGAGALAPLSLCLSLLVFVLFALRGRAYTGAVL